MTCSGAAGGAFSSAMRRALSVLGPVSVLAGAVFACEGDPNTGPGPNFQLDGSTPAFDGGQQPFDSGTPIPDASPDAPSGPPSVTVTVMARSGPKADVRVVFHDATGAVLETKLTDASGKAKSTGALPAMASALLSSGGDRQIVTWTGLENGDDLVVREPESSESLLAQYAVTLPGPFDVAGLTRYDTRASDCSGFIQETSGTIELYRYCAPNDTSSVLVRAIDPDNQVVGHSFKKANAVPTDGSTLAVATGAWTAPTTVTVTATNTQGQDVSVDLLEIADGHGYADGFDHPVENGSATFATATGFSDALQATIGLWPDSLGSMQTIAKRVAPGPTIQIDATQVLPAITSANIDFEANPRRPVLTWASSSTAAADGGLIRLQHWGASENRHLWTFVVPPGSTTVTAPAMPVEANDYLPDVDAGPIDWMTPEVVFIESDVFPTYKEFRRQQGTLAPADTSFRHGFPALPANGTYRATSWVLSL